MAPAWRWDTEGRPAQAGAKANVMPKAARAKAGKSRLGYRAELRELQIALVRAHRHIIRHGWRVLVLLEGRDASGKDGAIHRIVEHLSPRETRVVALGVPSDRELGQWYFQRFVAHLPGAGEFVLFNRSWYNRAGVERVMQFCTPAQTAAFLRDMVPFERMLVRAGIILIKYYLDISREEQRRRLKARARDPLSQWKTSAVDEAALAHWDDYTRARDEMLRRTNSRSAPWTVVRADDKKQARLNLIRDLVRRIEFPGRREPAGGPDASIVLPMRAGRLRELAH
jgi:polyphosphate kinase 2